MLTRLAKSKLTAVIPSMAPRVLKYPSVWIELECADCLACLQQQTEKALWQETFVRFSDFDVVVRSLSTVAVAELRLGVCVILPTSASNYIGSKLAPADKKRSSMKSFKKSLMLQ
jgi:hypothetical protein